MLRLSENISSVRESAAIALVTISQITKNEEALKEYLKLNLMKAKEQKSETITEIRPISPREEQKGDISPGKSRSILNSDIKSNVGFERLTELWELSDSCIFLIREIACSKNE